MFLFSKLRSIINILSSCNFFPKMEISLRFALSLLTLLLLTLPSTTSSPISIRKSRMLYQIDCTMCSTCCNPGPSRPPPSLSPPPPPPPSPSSNCPPPPSPPSTPSSGPYYYSPPPPPPPSSNYTYSSPPPPKGGGIGGSYYPPPTYKNYPGPPPPNPIVPYFPFYYYSPPPPNISRSIKLKGSLSCIFSVGVVLLYLF